MTTDAERAPTRRQRVEERERALIDAAREVFLEKGLDGARIAEIARRAGVAEGTVYLYYKTKNDLMRALVADFWDRLTEGARQAVSAHAEPFAQLRALARFHLTALIERFDIIELTQSLRTVRAGDLSMREHMKTYVAVFDGVFRRGADLGAIRSDTPLWMARDLFFGALEYSARTLQLRGQTDTEGVVNHLMGALERSYGLEPPATRPRQAMTDDALQRLERAVDRLESLSGA